MHRKTGKRERNTDAFSKPIWFDQAALFATGGGRMGVGAGLGVVGGQGGVVGGGATRRREATSRNFGSLFLDPS